MNVDFPNNIFVTGTDTGIGKTIVSAILVSGLNASYWKPIQCGLDQETDSEFVQRVTTSTGMIFPEAYRLCQPMSPHVAAPYDGIAIDLDSVTLPQCAGPLIIEGAGGVYVPLNERVFMIDLIRRLDIPVLVVSSSRVGTINHTLLTLRYLREYGCTVFGVVVNGPVNCSNREAITLYGQVDVIAEIEEMTELNHTTISQAFRSFGGGTSSSNV